MKKILSVLLCLVLLLGLWVVPANATADVTYTVTTDHQGELRCGDEITFIVTVIGTAKVTQLGFNKPQFDTDVFEYVEDKPEAEDEEPFDEAINISVADALISSATRTDGLVVLWQKAKTLPGSLELGKITLKVKANAPVGATEVTALQVSAKNGSTTVATELQGATVNVSHNVGAWTKVNDATHERVCSDCGYKETANHAWDAGVVDPNPTCGAAGTKTFTCECGATKTESVPATGNHTPGAWEKVDNDTHKRVCSVCGKNEETAAHVWNDGVVTKPNDCGNDGVMTYTCECGATKTEAIPATGNHTGGEATCKVLANCSVCGAAYGELNANNHKNTEIRGAYNPTCNDAGYTGDTWCKDCETKISTGTAIDPTGAHVDADGKWESNADQHFHTCGCGTKFDYTNHAGGEATCKALANCSVCGAAYGSLNTNNHKNTEIRGAYNPTCNDAGYTGDTWCKDCETKISTGTAIDPTGAHVDADNKWEANAEQHFHTCGCGTKFDYTNHTHSAWEKVDNDTHKRNCTVCGLDEETAAHAWNEGVVTKPNDCGNDGVKTYTCACGATKTETIAATGNHTAGAWTKVDNDTHKRVCSVCGKNEEIASHKWNDGVVTKPNDCGNDGVKTYTCTDCGATKTETIAATGNHTAGAWTKVDNDTHKRVCSVCGKNEETAAHAWNDGVVTTAPGCGSTGVKTYTCADCGATKTETIAATGNHTWDEGAVTKLPTAEADGVMTYGCVDCDATKDESFNVTYEIVADKEAIKRGEEITYTIYVSSNKALSSIDFDLNLNTNIFEIVSGETTLAGATNSFSAENGFNAVFAEPQMVEGKVVFGTITVKVKENADFGDVKVQGTPSVQGGSGNLAFAFASVPTVKIECDTHTFSAWAKVDDKDHAHVCSVCGKSEAAAHAWDAGKVTVEATESKVGEKTYTCADCGATKTEEIAKTTPVTADAVNPALFVVLMVLAFAGMAVVTVGKKKFHG